MLGVRTIITDVHRTGRLGGREREREIPQFPGSDSNTHDLITQDFWSDRKMDRVSISCIMLLENKLTSTEDILPKRRSSSRSEARRPGITGGQLSLVCRQAVELGCLSQIREGNVEQMRIDGRL